MMEIYADLDKYELGDVVLDVGTGFGSVVRYLLARGIRRIYTVDIDPSAVSSIKRELRDAVEAGILKAMVAPAEALPFPNAFFDSVVSVAVLHHVRDIDAVLREMARVARLAIAYDWTPEAAGITNPHSPEELKRSMERAVATAKALGYKVERRHLWYKVVKQRET